MKKLNILHLYYDIANLSGESGNMLAIKRCLDEQHISYSIDKLTLNDKIDFNKYDLVYLGHMNYEVQETIRKDILKYKKELLSRIEDGMYFISTGNSYELELKSGDVVKFDLSSYADGYTCFKSLKIKETDRIITFGWDGNFTTAEEIKLPESYTSDDCDWGSDYTALYEAFTYTAANDQTLILTPYLGGSGIDLNYDYVIAILAAIIILFFSLHTLILESMATYKYTMISFGLANAIIVTYALGVFFKALNKASLKGKALDFSIYGKYLYASIGIVLVFMVVFVISFIIKKKKNNQIEVSE